MIWIAAQWTAATLHKEVFPWEECLKTYRAFFVYPGIAPPSTSLLHQYCFVPKRHPVLGTQLLSTQNGGSTACGAAACSLSANTGNTGCVNMKELYLRLTGGPSVSELIRHRPNKFLKCWWACDEVGADTWTDMVGGGTVSGLLSMLRKPRLEVLLLLLLSRFCRVWLCEIPETAAHQAPLSLSFSRQEHWSGVPLPSLLEVLLGHIL